MWIWLDPVVYCLLFRGNLKLKNERMYVRMKYWKSLIFINMTQLWCYIFLPGPSKFLFDVFSFILLQNWHNFMRSFLSRCSYSSDKFPFLELRMCYSPAKDPVINQFTFLCLFFKDPFKCHHVVSNAGFFHWSFQPMLLKVHILKFPHFLSLVQMFSLTLHFQTVSVSVLFAEFKINSIIRARNVWNF